MKPILLFVLVILMWSTPVRAETPGEVFREGAAKFEAKKFREAAELFEKAFALAPSAQAAYNAGIAWDEADVRARAANALTRAVNLGELSSPELREASRRLGILVPTLGKLVFESPTGAEVRVGDQSVTSPGVLYVDPGEHALEVKLPEGKERRESVRIGAGESRTLSFVEEKPAVLPPRQPPAKPPEKKRSGASTSPVLGYVALGLAAACVGTGVYLNVRGLNENRDYEDGGKRDANQRERAVNLRTFAFVAYGAGAVFGGVGTVFLLTSGEKESGVAYRASF